MVVKDNAACPWQHIIDFEQKNGEHTSLPQVTSHTKHISMDYTTDSARFSAPDLCHFNSRNIISLIGINAHCGRTATCIFAHF